MNAHGEAITQACYQGGCPSGGCSPHGACGCGPRGGGGLLGGGLLGGALGAGMFADQCGPHYFDFSAEYLWYQRSDEIVNESMIISTFGFANDADVTNGTIPASQIALTGDSLGEDMNHGYRLAGRLDLGALSVAEFTYSSLYTEGANDSVTARGPALTDQLFSVFSLYGTATNGNFGDPGAAGAPTGPNFAETDNASLHSISYKAQLQSAEANYRRYWVGYDPRISGTLLVGFRWTNLNEEMTFFSQGVDGNISLGSETDNILAGAQAGGDAWICVTPGIRIGGEAKAGIFNNHYTFNNTGGAGASRIEGDQAAFLTEAKLSAIANITPSCSLKIGYEVLYMSDLAQMGDSLFASMPYGDINNISTTPVGGNISPSMPSTTNGDAFYHGAHAGFEFIW